MRAVTVTPGSSGTARLEEVAEPEVGLGSVVVETMRVADRLGAHTSRHEATGVG